jgi:hypothetical protein
MLLSAHYCPRLLAKSVRQSVADMTSMRRILRRTLAVMYTYLQITGPVEWVNVERSRFLYDLQVERVRDQYNCLQGVFLRTRGMCGLRFSGKSVIVTHLIQVYVSVGYIQIPSHEYCMVLL